MDTKQEWEDILFYAFRYTLGRKTYAVSTVTAMLIKHKDLLSGSTKDVIRREIHAAIIEDKAGMDCDVAEWKHVLEGLENE